MFTGCDFTNDIYFMKEYGKIHALLEDNGTSETFELANEYGKIRHMFIKREIPEIIDGVTYYDLVTPYGYGGPIIIESCGQNEKLVHEFADDFAQYCKKNNIVSEFVRFHPAAGNGVTFDGMYNAEHIRNTVGTNLADFDDPVQSEFSKSCRRIIRQSLKKNVSYKIIHAPESLDSFTTIYYETMKRNTADDFYYFSPDYFHALVREIPQNILYVEAVYEGKIIAAALCFVASEFIHEHLAGTYDEYMHLSPIYILRYGMALYGKEHGYKLIHYGGGRSNDVEDTLYQSKKRFAANTDFAFYVGRKIWNQEIYQKLCERKQCSTDEPYFPAYRSIGKEKL